MKQFKLDYYGLVKATRENYVPEVDVEPEDLGKYLRTPMDDLCNTTIGPIIRVEEIQALDGNDDDTYAVYRVERFSLNLYVSDWKENRNTDPDTPEFIDVEYIYVVK